MAFEISIKPDGTKEVIERMTVETVTRKTRAELQEIIVNADIGIAANQAAKQKAEAELSTYKTLFDQVEGAVKK